MQNLTLLCGGTGGHGTTTGIKLYSEANPQELRQENTSVVVSMFDSGGHSRNHVDERKDKDAKGEYLPPGDLRQILSAGANNKIQKALFEHRSKGGLNKNKSQGNDILDSLYEIEGSFESAIEKAREILDTRIKVYPCSLQRASLAGILASGQEITGEDELVKYAKEYNHAIKEVFLKPEKEGRKIEVNPKAIKAILEADKIVLCQGSLYTSLMPVLLVPGIKEALAETKGKVIYVVNITTQRGETDDYTARNHADVISKQVGETTIDNIIINSSPISNESKHFYYMKGQKEVIDDFGNDKKIIRVPLLEKDAVFLRHDPYKLAETIVNL